MRKLIAHLLILFSTPTCLAQDSSLLDETFGVKQVASGCEFTEGPAIGLDGALYFSDQPNDRIMRLDGEKLEVFLSPCGTANGLLFDREGSMVMCQSSRPGGARAVSRLSMTSKKLETLTDHFKGERYIAPNDLCVDREGRIYFTDPYYEGEKSQPNSGVYRLDPDGKVRLLIDSLQKPNGIAITPDNTTLFVSDRGTQKLQRYKIGDEGSIVHDGVHYDFSPDRGIDGMAIDVEGNIWGAAGQGETTGLFVISPDGQLLLHKPMPEFSTNVAFGGADSRDLFLTATTSVYKMRTNIPGVRPAYYGNVFTEDPKLILEKGAGEGPAWHPEKGLLFSGDGGINRLNPKGTVERYVEGTATNGLLFDRQGRLLRCETKNGRIARANRELYFKPLAGGFNQPNDITVDSKGRIYFSDPKYGSRDGFRQFDQDRKPIEGVYRIDQNGSVHRIITHEVDRPNGVLVTSDDKYLFVADNNNNTSGGARFLFRFDLKKDGTIDFPSKRLIYDWGTGRGPDGMVQDSIGRIFVAGGRNKANLPHETVDANNKAGIYVFDLDGRLLDFAAIPRDEVTNCTFGGDDWKTLYITAGGTLWSIRTTSPGHLPMNPD